MTVSRLTLAALAIQSPTLISFVTWTYIGAVQPTAAQMAFLVRLEGVLAGLLYLVCFVVLLLLFAIGRRTHYPNKFARYYVAVPFAAIIYFSGALVLSPAVGSTVSYSIGDLYRTLLPLITLVVLFSVYPGSDAFRERFIDVFVVIVVALALIGGAWKAYYVGRGVFYGSGLMQYSVGSFLLSYVLIRITHRAYSPSGGALWSVVLFTLVALSILSLKRGVWISIALTITLVLIVSLRRTRALVFVGSLAMAGGIFGHYSGLTEIITDRFMYTFSGEYGIDRSSFERVAEGAGALYSMNSKDTPLVYLTGLGHGAEFRGHPEFPLLKGSTGSAAGLYHHIHSTPFLLLFRYGLLGIGWFLMLIAPALITARRLGSRRFRAFLLRDRYGQIYVASLIGIATTLVTGIQGNIIYGDTSFAVNLFVLVSAFLAASREFEVLESTHA